MQGLASAQYKTGLNYLQGYGTEANDSEAAMWFLEAAKQGHKEAAFNLSKMYMNGQGVAPNMIEAIKWLKISAALGHEGAQHNLNMMNNLKLESGSVINLNDQLVN